MTQEELKQKIQYLRELEIKYQECCHTASVSGKAKDTFREWYNATITFFHECGLDDNDDCRWLLAQGIPVSGVDMFKVFNAFHPKFRLLLIDIENGKYFTQVQKPTMALEPDGVLLPLVFISHASENIGIIREFIDLILKNGLGLSDENIVCTSLEWTTVSLGDNIPAYIHKNIEQSSVVLSMVSQAYKDSKPCQNEVGAAWALKRKPISIILPDADFSELGWLVNLDKAGRIDDADFLNHLQVDLCNRLGIQAKTALHWSPCVKRFLENIKKVAPTSQTKVKAQPKLSQPQRATTAEQNHDKDLFMAFNKEFSEEIINYTLYSIQHSTHFSDFDLTIWHKIIYWFGLTSNTFLTNDIQETALLLLESYKKLIAFIGKASYSPDRISWSTEEDRNVTPEKWREIHEARIYSWEPETHDTNLYNERHKMIFNGIPSIVENIENAYKAFRMSIKKNLFI